MRVKDAFRTAISATIGCGLVGTGVYIAATTTVTPPPIHAGLLAALAGLWILFMLHSDVEKRREYGRLAEQLQHLQDRCRNLQQEVDLLTAQRELSKVTPSDEEETDTATLMNEILEVVGNLVNAHENMEYLYAAVLMEDENSLAIIGEVGRNPGEVPPSLAVDAWKHASPLTSMEKDLIEFAIPLKSDVETSGVIYTMIRFHGDKDRLSTSLDLLQQSLTALASHAAIPISKHVLKNHSIRDGLTGLYNKRCFVEHLARAFEKARTGGKPLSLIMMDVDHFKRINDTYGHASGDMILKEVARRMVQVVGKKGKCYRYGGEEMAVILEDRRLDEATETAEEIRMSMADKRFEVEGGKRINVTVSLGAAQADERCGDEEVLLNLADAALYRAKKSGRNRTCAA